MNLLDCIAVDPGPEKCGVVVVRDGRIDASERTVGDVSDLLRAEGGVVLIEALSNYGSPLGDDLIHTGYVIGHLATVAREPVLIRRIDVKKELLGSTVGGDPILWQRLVSLFGGDTAKRKGGPLFKVSGHARAALALACAWTQMRERGTVPRVRRHWCGRASE